MNKRLKRSTSNKIIAGVCGGIGEYFDIDPVIIRIIWVILAFMPSSPGVLAYIICALIIPESNGAAHNNSSTNTSNTPIFIGIALIAIGGFMLLDIIFPRIWHIFNIFNIFEYWPILLILAGAYIIYKQRGK